MAIWLFSCVLLIIFILLYDCTVQLNMNINHVSTKIFGWLHKIAFCIADCCQVTMVWMVCEFIVLQYESRTLRCDTNEQ